MPHQLKICRKKSSKRLSSKSTAKTRGTKALYYTADTGHFGVPIVVCFNDTVFQQALKNFGITTRHNALDFGLAESHYIQQEGTHSAMLAIVFNFEEMAKCDALERMGVIYHEVSHTVTHVFEYIGEDDSKIGDESRSYLGEHIFKQVFSIYATEEEKREGTRKRDRAAFVEIGEKIRGAKLQVAEHDNRGTGPDSIHKSENVLDRVKDANRTIKPETKPGI